MNVASIQDWILWLTGALLGLGGLVLAAWALFWDRSRGRKRCPKCWYDMSAAVATLKDGREVFVCPECGRAVPHTRALERTRRRSAWAIVGTLAIMSAYVVAKAPEWRRGNWTVLVPTSALVFLAETTDRSPFMRLGNAPSKIARLNRMMLLQGIGSAPNATPLSVSEALEAAAWSRLEDGRMSRWQSQVFVGRYLGAARHSLADRILAPDRWLAGEPMPIMVAAGQTPQFWLPGGVAVRSDVGPVDLSRPQFVATPTRPGDRVSAALDVRDGERVLYEQLCSLPTVLVGGPADVLPPVDSADATDLVRLLLDLRVVDLDGELCVAADDRGDTSLWRSIDFGVAYRVEVVVGDQTVGKGAGAVTWNYVPWEQWTNVLEMEWAPGGRERMRERPGAAKFVVTGNTGEAWGLYRSWPFGKPNPRAWAGRYEAPVVIVPPGAVKAPHRKSREPVTSAPQGPEPR